jgi:excinuclease ABC subunit A
LIVVTGLSGSGKSSLAFDTLYAEGQRRYIETFSPYARQFFDRMDKPAVDRIENIPPAIAIEQRNSVRTSRSTVGTMTELCEHLKAVWPHVARLHCRQCGRPVVSEPPAVVWTELLKTRPAESDLLVTFDLPLSEKLPIAEQLALLQKQGFQRVLLAGETVRVEMVVAALQGAMPAQVLTVVADRIRLTPAQRSRFLEACESAYHFGKGRLAVHSTPGGAGDAQKFSAGVHCAACDLAYPESTPALFSFNHPVGACAQCRGFGRVIEIDWKLVMPDLTRTLAEGVVKPWLSGVGAESQGDLVKMAKKRGIPLQVPFLKLTEEQRTWVVDGEPGYGSDEDHRWPQLWYGVRGYFRWLESNSYKMHYRVLLSRYRSYQTCPLCQGRRFNRESLLYRVPVGRGETAISLADFYALSIQDALALVKELALRHRAKPHEPLGVALSEVEARLGFLVEVGLGYLTLDRTTRTLSGGETERVNLTTCLGTRLCQTLFVLDEPSVGLHPRDTDRLIRILLRLRDHGNTVVVVEHEASVMRAADQLVDLGPGHGETGGHVVFQGDAEGLRQTANSLTADYLTGRRWIEVPVRRPVRVSADPVLPGLRERPEPWAGIQSASGASLCLSGATANNLQRVSVTIPLGRLVGVSGVSGSGKSTLIREVLLPLLQARLAPLDGPVALEEEVDGESRAEAVAAIAIAELTGVEHLGAVVLVDQSSLGRTPRSNPAVYSGAFDDIRDFYAASPEAREAGLNASSFSFNSAAGQCDRCRGAGFEKIEMQFLSDVFIKCPACQGRRYREHVLAVKVAAPASTEGVPGSAFSIGDLLELTIEDARDFFQRFADSKPARRAAAKLQLLCEVGLGYLRTGQPINTLSGGEAQRLKLVSHLAESAAAPASTRRPGRTAENPYSSDAEPQLPKPTLFLFDEPTTGLHFDDVRVLLAVFQRLVDAGHTVLVIEHNLDVLRSTDWLIDLGPEGGAAGGRVLVAGTPEEVAACRESHTGRFLRESVPSIPGPHSAVTVRRKK